MKTIKLICLITMLLQFGIYSTSRSEEKKTVREITVSGTAEVKAVPDLVTIQIAVETWDKNIMQVKKHNDKLINEIYIIIKQLNIPENNIKTSYISLNPTYESNKRGNKISGFTLRNDIEIKLNNITILDTLIYSLLAIGITNIEGIYFNTSQLKKIESEARILAIRDAKNKANSMANELGVKVLSPISIKVGFDPYNDYSGTAFRAGMPVPVPDAELAPIKKGELTISESVTITFEIE